MEKTKGIVNNDIVCERVMLVGDGTNQEMSLADALNLAEDEGLDLMQVSMNGDIAVCKLIDYSKFKYNHEKAMKKNRTKNKAKHNTKEIRVSWKISEHDLTTKVNNIHRIISKDKDKVRVVIQFKGREIAMIEHGYKIADKIKENLINAKCTDAQRDGNNIQFVVESIGYKH